MRQNSRSYIIKINLVSIVLCLFFVLCQKTVFGFSFDTTLSSRTNCEGCHSLRKSKAKAGSWAVRNDVIRELEPYESASSDRWACDPCHQSRNPDTTKFNFSLSDTSIMPEGGQSYGTTGFYPSAHPVPVLWKNVQQIVHEDSSFVDGRFVGRVRKIMYCTNCHDPLQVGRGIHKTYVSAFRLKFSGVDSAGVRHFDPDPTDDTVSLGSDSTSWFWSRPFDTSDASFTGVLKFGFIPHQADSAFSVKNPREANKERTNFETMGTKTIYFCVTCHDENGYPQDPMDTTADVTDTSARRTIPQNFANGLYGYNASDGNDSSYTPGDGGHVIQGVSGTNNGYKLGDKLACVECHDPHSSKYNKRLIKDSLQGSLGYGGSIFSEGIPKEFCKKCHDNELSTYYNGGAFTKFGAAGLSDMLPLVDSKGRDMSGAHQGAGNYVRKTCYSFVPSGTESYYTLGGCHKDPHRPTMFCNACHKDHYDVPTVKAKTGHPMGVQLTSVPLPGDTISVKDYYRLYADSLEVPLFGGTNGYYNGYIDCFTCHNDHSITGSTTYASQMQSLLRGDAGPLDSANNYPDHDSTYNENLRVLATGSGGITDGEYESMRAMPELCINCHFRVVGVQFNHGGFSRGGFGRCDKCHSMHGQHPEPAKGAPVDSTCLIRPLRYGMYLDTGKVTTFTELNAGETTAWYIAADSAGEVYATTRTKLNELGEFVYYTAYVWKDANGDWFSNSKNDFLLHDPLQQNLCGKCHGNPAWLTIVDTAGNQKPPPQVLFDTTGTPRADTLDMYYTTYDYQLINRNRSTHALDLKNQKPPGFSAGGLASLKCSSGTKGAGCHNPHGNSNFGQLNAMVMESTSSSYGSAVVPYTTTGTGYITRSYVSGMTSFCSLCHDDFGCSIYDSSKPEYYDTFKGRYPYTRHPVGAGVSLLNLYDSADRGLVDSTFFINLVLDYDTTIYTNGKPSYNQFLNANAAYASTNFVVACVTCHRQHGSPNLHLRKFNDQGVFECVGCHGKSPDILK